MIYMKFCTFWRLKFTKLSKFREQKMAKMAGLELLVSAKLISRKIWMREKSWNFHTVHRNLWYILVMLSLLIHSPNNFLSLFFLPNIPMWVNYAPFVISIVNVHSTFRTISTDYMFYIFALEAGYSFPNLKSAWKK